MKNEKIRAAWRSWAKTEMVSAILRTRYWVWENKTTRKMGFAVAIAVVSLGVQIAMAQTGLGMGKGSVEKLISWVGVLALPGWLLWSSGANWLKQKKAGASNKEKIVLESRIGDLRGRTRAQAEAEALREEIRGSKGKDKDVEVKRQEKRRAARL